MLILTIDNLAMLIDIQSCLDSRKHIVLGISLLENAQVLDSPPYFTQEAQCNFAEFSMPMPTISRSSRPRTSAACLTQGRQTS